MKQFLTVDVIPDCINGDVSNNNGTADIAAGSIIFDWTAVDVPCGSGMIQSISAIVNAEDGTYAAGSLTDYEILFAKSLRGQAPPSIGTINQSADGVGWHEHFIGAVQIEGTAGVGTLRFLDTHVVYNAATTGNGANGGRGSTLPLVYHVDHTVNTNKGYDKIYVAGIQTLARNYGTGVLADGAVDGSADQSTTITVKTVDARKIFCVGDTVYVHDLNTPIPGTLTKVEATTLTFSEANTTVDIADSDELLTANPIRIKLGIQY
jgi:hypothetical protein